MSEAYIFCDGYHKLGWEPNEWIEMWLAKHIVSYLINNYYEDYKAYIGMEPIDKDGSICRLPSKEEIEML